MQLINGWLEDYKNSIRKRLHWSLFYYGIFMFFICKDINTHYLILGFWLL